MKPLTKPSVYKANNFPSLLFRFRENENFDRVREGQK